MSDGQSLRELEQGNDFLQRHIGPGDLERAEMLTLLGVDSLEALVDETVPEAIRYRGSLNLPAPLSEQQALARMRVLAGNNRLLHSMIGMGYHDCVVPAVLRRNLLENPGWYTAYTPYQAEISQGRLQMLLNFQQLIIDLSGLPLANASLLDEATAAAEAMSLCRRLNRRSQSQRFFVAEDLLPQTLAVVRTRAAGLGIEVVTGSAVEPTGEYFGALLQYPGTGASPAVIPGCIRRLQGAGARVVLACDPLALVLLAAPGEIGADIAVGSSQRFGVPMGYGGPHAGWIAAGEEALRSLPGRLIGVSSDCRGGSAVRMALQTREQHIRRERATSNICTAQSLLANMAAGYAIYHGAEGLRRIALRVHRMARILAAGLTAIGCAPDQQSFFDSLRISVSAAAEIVERARTGGVNLYLYPDAAAVGVSVNECSTREHLLVVLDAFALGREWDLDVLDAGLAPGLALPGRESEILTHPVFYQYRSETEMMRYLARLERMDLALNQSMIGLGSCTMKLNAAAEMEPVSWPGFAGLHPFVPLEQAVGYAQLFTELEAMLAAVTGFTRISLQPNAGSQGEYAGLLAIRAWHQSRGEGGRDLCLIPTSAHGTNPASAVLAGYQIVLVECDGQGNIDISHLQQLLAEQGQRVAALMVTYPSTHGVFEEAIVQVCELVHQSGGQVYLDGANLNAMMGIARPGDFGADVSHLNLHKTFCIPHGGGGPGVGAIGVAAHLAPFLPGHPLIAPPGTEGNPPVSAAPWGSAGILPISWSYIAMMGEDGLRRSSQVAMLNANYLAARLQEHFPVLYRGRNGRVAHECILDLRPLKERSGVTEEDVAKRLMDFGFHAPTMSFPVPGTLMVEPTESEGRAELDRFVEAMAVIRAEIAAVERGEQVLQDSPLRCAPHSLADLTDQAWERSYSRAQAFLPGSWQRRDNKYWPPVNRIDNVAGDRNPLCACPLPEAWRDG